jgi:diadenosine tetraphosphatase ApaH/serine/threonine PP2A family protein phosphatase
MKIIIFSDVHGNLEALHAAFRFIEKYPDASIYSLGDIVGYGANPKECISEVRKIVHVSLAGNHDHAAIGLTSIKYFNPYAKEAVIWTSKCLDEEDKRYLLEIPLYKKINQKIFIVHSSPLEPDQWHYIMTINDAKRNFAFFKEPLCFIGHSHSPMVIGLNPKGDIFQENDEIVQLKAENRYIINVGSIGQPRDSDWRACLVIYDDESRIIEFKRLEYEVHTAREKIYQAGLPDRLAERLLYGI